MSDQENDYMSDIFLTESTSQDVRPGLLFNRSQQREIEQYKKRQEQQARPKPKEKENLLLREGLSTAITSDNKGFQLLKKMGYRSGESLGKANTGITEPIAFEKKNNKAGLGKRTNEDVIKYDENVNKKICEKRFRDTEREFRNKNYEKRVMKTLKRDFENAQKSCEILDEQAGVDQPEVNYFWSINMQQTVPVVEETACDVPMELLEEASLSDENLQNLLQYLREKYCFCIYCGAKGEDTNDLNSFCPGVRREDHSEIE